MNTRLKTVILAVVVFLYWMGLYLYVPTLPTYVEGKTANLAVVGIVLSMYGLWQAIIRLPIGIAADWAGRRKPFILFGLLLVGLGAWLLGTAQGVNGLTVGRTITGLAAGTWVPLVVLFSSFFPPEDAVRASAILNFVAFGGRMLATGLTGTLNQAGGYSLAFYLATGVAAAAILVMLTIPEKRRKVQRPSTGDIARLITRQDVLLPSLASTVSHYAIFATTFGFLPILAKQLGATDVIQSVFVTMNIGLGLVSSLLVTAFVGRVGSRQLVYLSFLFLAAGTAAPAIVPSLPVIFAGQILLGFGFGMSYSVLMGMSIRYVEDSQRTTAMGLFQSVYSIGMFAGPWISGILASMMGIRAMLGVTAFICLAVGVLLTWQLGRIRAVRQVSA